MTTNQATKCWKINNSQIDDGYLYSEMTIYANTHNEARSLLLNKYRYEVQVGGKDPTYISIPVIRHREGDLIEYDGKLKSRNQVSEILKQKARNMRLDDISNDPEISHCYIKKGGNYYMSDCCGYTEWKVKAGVYSKEEAVREAKSCNAIDIIPIDIHEHNLMIEKAIRDFKSRLL